MAANRATLEFSYADATIAETVERAIELDAGEVEGDRSSAAVERSADTVIVDIEAADPSALRAAKRTWCNQVAAAESTAVASR